MDNESRAFDYEHMLYIEQGLDIFNWFESIINAIDIDEGDYDYE